MSRALLIVVWIVLLPALSWAQNNVWPFDFDPTIAADPAGVNSRLSELAEGVPPIPAGDLAETSVGPVKLYFHAAMLELLELAYDSGPGHQAYFLRDPVTCSEHAAFSFPDLLSAGAGFSCQQAVASIEDAFGDDAQDCLRMEFPELYIQDQPVGEAAGSDLQTLEGLISVAGEPLSHIDYVQNLLPTGFEADVRRILKKVRRDTLMANATGRRSAYLNAQLSLSNNGSCFDPSAAASLDATIDNLIAELDVALADLDAVHNEGLAQAAADRQALWNAGRTRPELPFPSLSDAEREMIALYIGGIYWRMRGEALLAYPGMSFLEGLLYVEYPYEVLANLTGGSDGDGAGRDLFIHENWGYADWMDIGHEPGNDKYSDLVDMAKRGKRTLTLAEPRLRNRGYDTAYFFAGGLQMGPCYYYGWDPLWDNGRFFQLGEDLLDPPYMWFLQGPTAHGEFCTGAALGLGLARTLLNGKPAGPDSEPPPPPPPPPDAGPDDAGPDDAGPEDTGPDDGSPDAGPSSSSDALDAGPDAPPVQPHPPEANAPQGNNVSGDVGDPGGCNATGSGQTPFFCGAMILLGLLSRRRRP
jgi:uncharacterized protein (TIGR03382 family)